MYSHRRRIGAELGDIHYHHHLRSRDLFSAGGNFLALFHFSLQSIKSRHKCQHLLNSPKRLVFQLVELACKFCDLTLISGKRALTFLLFFSLLLQLFLAIIRLRTEGESEEMVGRTLGSSLCFRSFRPQTVTLCPAYRLIQAILAVYGQRHTHGHVL